MQITDHEAERRVLSSMMHSETACVEALDKMNEDDFSDLLNRQVFLLLSNLYSRNVNPTLVELLKEGHTLGLIEKSEDLDAIKHIAQSYIEDENIGYWISKVKQAKKTRETQNLLKTYSTQMKNNKADIDELVGNMSSACFNLAMDTESEKIDTPAEIADLGIKLTQERVQKYREQAEDCRVLGEVPLEGVPTGFKALDKMTLGLKPGDLAILGAETGHGKTAFAMNLAKAACIDHPNNLLYVNTEMSKEQIARRWGAILSNITLYQVQSGSLTNEQQDIVINSYNTLLRKSGFYPCSIPNLTPQKLDVLARKAKLQRNIKLLVLDYVGRMDKITPEMQEWQVLEQIMKSVKLLAQNLQIACFVLVQLNSDGTLQGAKRMENECDLMIKLLPLKEDKRQEIQRYMEQKLKKKFEEFNYRLFIQKARDSESGRSIPIVFDKKVQQMREAKELDDPWLEIGKEVKSSEI